MRLTRAFERTAAAPCHRYVPESNRCFSFAQVVNAVTAIFRLTPPRRGYAHSSALSVAPVRTVFSVVSARTAEGSSLLAPVVRWKSWRSTRLQRNASSSGRGAASIRRRLAFNTLLQSAYGADRYPADSVCRVTAQVARRSPACDSATHAPASARRSSISSSLRAAAHPA